jgi:hypothetical protein
MKTRIKERKADINKRESPSVIFRHRLELSHDFDWDNIKIFYEEPSYYKRSISEMVFINA